MIVIILLVIGYSAFTRTQAPVESPTPTASPIISETITPTETPVVSQTPTEKTFTMAEVAVHKDAKSCYTVVNGNVYDVTSFITKHPGGASKILSLCGKDGSDKFNNQHGGSELQESTLAGFQIGILVK